MESDIFSKMRLGPDKTDFDGLTQALQAVGASYAREVRATLVAEGNVRDAAAIMDGFSEAFQSAAQTVARAVCTGEPRLLASRELSLDENLLPNSVKRAAK